MNKEGSTGATKSNSKDETLESSRSGRRRRDPEIPEESPENRRRVSRIPEPPSIAPQSAGPSKETVSDKKQGEVAMAVSNDNSPQSSGSSQRVVDAGSQPKRFRINRG